MGLGLTVERGRPGERGSERADVAVVMDVLRMTTTAATLMSRCARAAVAATLDDLYRLEGSLADYVIVSELPEAAQRGQRIDNSPVTAAKTDLASRTPVLVTTNGTQALLDAAERAERVLRGEEPNLKTCFSLIREDERVVEWAAGASAYSMDLDFALQADRFQTALQFEALGAGVGHIVAAA